MIRLTIDFGLLILIWLVQVIIYPTFRQIVPEKFKVYHRRYTGQITWFVVPLMFGQVGLHSYELYENVNPLNIINAMLILMAWLVTFGLSVPCHSKLAKHGYDLAVINRLVWTNWLRTIAWTGVVILDILLIEPPILFA
ncbi:MAG: hypothetical protein ACF8OB_11800 [Phycisphaeraceae bacterium JB051]